MSEHDDKPYYKIGEVCELTGTQPYVLRFWESEFPTLAPEKNRSGQRIYRKRDIDLIHRIKTLLYEKEYTIAGARKVLEGNASDESGETADATTATGGSHSAKKGGNGGPGERPHPGSGGAAHARAGSRGGGEEASPGERHGPGLPFPGSHGADLQLEAEVKNLRAKLARAEAELRGILTDMRRHDES